MEKPYDASENTVTDQDLVNWPKVAVVSAMVSCSIPTFMTGIELFTLLSWSLAWQTLLIGGILLTLVGGLMGTIGASTRKNSYMLVQIGFGKMGAQVLNLLFALSLVGWFGLNLDLFSASIMQIIGPSENNYFYAICIEAIAGIIMISTTLYGFKIINKVSVLLIPIMLLLTIAMYYQSAQTLSFSDFISSHDKSSASLSQGVSMIVGVIIIGAIILPDITRFSRQKRGGLYTAFWSYLVVQTIVLIIAAYAASAFKAHDVLAVFVALGIGSWSLLIVLAGTWVLNALNLYSAELAVSASLPKSKNKYILMILGAAGLLAAFANILDVFVLFLSVLTAIFIPIAGIIGCDYLLLNKQAYSNNKQPLKALQAPAVFAWCLGASIAIYDLFSPFIFLTSIAAIDAILVSATAHLILTYIFRYAKKNRYRK